MKQGLPQTCLDFLLGGVQLKWPAELDQVIFLYIFLHK